MTKALDEQAKEIVEAMSGDEHNVITKLLEPALTSPSWWLRPRDVEHEHIPYLYKFRVQGLIGLDSNKYYYLTNLGKAVGRMIFGIVDRVYPICPKCGDVMGDWESCSIFYANPIRYSRCRNKDCEWDNLESKKVETVYPELCAILLNRSDLRVIDGALQL